MRRRRPVTTEADQTVIAGHRDFDRVSLFRRRQERHESADWKIGMPHRVTAGIQEVTSGERDPHGERQQTLGHLPRQTGEKSIRSGHDASWRGTRGPRLEFVRYQSPLCGSNRRTSDASPLHTIGADPSHPIGVAERMVAETVRPTH